MSKLVLGVGRLGEGKYRAGENGDHTKAYDTWMQMLNRCYNTKGYKTNATYVECAVADGWLNFQNFAEWYYANYYIVGDETMCLDKDIIVKGNKVYSPSTAIFVPNKINMLFVKSKSIRGELPIGVVTGKNGKYRSRLKIDGKQKHLGTFDTVESAFQAYKEAKEKHIKNVAWKYRYYIPIRLYDALVEYKVEITD